MTKRDHPPKLISYPMDVLTNNIVHELEQAAARSNHSMARSVSEGAVNRVIMYDNGGGRPRPPCVELGTRMIHVKQSYAVYLWAFVYSSFVLFEEFFQKSMIEGAWVPADDLIEGAAAVGDWALRFAANVEPWDSSLSSLPSSTNEGDARQQAFVRKTNEVFLRSMTYLLLHEYGHLSLGHTRCDDGSWMVEQETDADNFARSFLINDSASSEKDRWIAGLSIVLVTTSSLFLAADFMDIWKTSHPHSVDRIRHAVSGLNLTTQQSKDYLYLLSSMHLARFLGLKNISVPPQLVDTPEDSLMYLLDRCDEVRVRAGQRPDAKPIQKAKKESASRLGGRRRVAAKTAPKKKSKTRMKAKTPATRRK